MPVTLGNLGHAVGLGRLGAGLYHAGIGTQAHGAALVARRIPALDLLGAEVEPFPHEVDDRMGRGQVEFLGVGPGEPEDVAGVFDDGALHAQANAEKGHAVFPGVADGRDLALDAAGAEAAGDQDPVDAGQAFGRVFRGDLLGIDVDEPDRHAVGHAAVDQGLVQALVGFLQVHVLADDGNGHGAGLVVVAVHERGPGFQIGVFRRQPQQDGNLLVHALAVELERQFINVFYVHGREHGVGVHVAEKRDLFLDVAAEIDFATADDDVGLDADGAQFLDAVLGGLGFDLAGHAQVGHQGQVDAQGVFPAEVAAQLADGLQKRLALDVAHGAADLDDGHILVCGHAEDGLLDLVGDVGNDLDRAAQIVAPALLLDDAEIDAARREVVVLAHGHAEEAFVVAEIEVGLRPVVGHVDLAVLKGVHGAGVDVDVRIELLDGDLKPSGLEQGADGCGGQPFTQGRQHPPRDENEFGLHRCRPCWLGPRRRSRRSASVSPRPRRGPG